MVDKGFFAIIDSIEMGISSFFERIFKALYGY